MTDFFNKEAELYPEILRRLAAGERLGTAADETEKMAAALLVAEALENEKAADAAPGEPAQEKIALVELGLGALLGGLAAGPVRRAIQKMRGEPDIPEHASQLLRSFREILEERQAAEAAKKKLLATGLIGAGAGALAAKALLGKKEEPAAKAASAGTSTVKVSAEDDEKSEGKDKKELPAFLREKSDKDEDDKEKDEKGEKGEKPEKDKKNGDEKSEKDDKSDEKKESSSPAAVLAKAGAGAPGARAILDRVLKSLA